jgi:hypothetical protein
MADAHIGTSPFMFRFHDWPTRHGGTPKPTKEDVWLYIFQVHKAGSRLYEEVYLEAERQRYLRVDLAQYAGQDPRPVAEPGTDTCWLDDNSVHVLKEVRYYILCSPFQLHWSRIKNLAKKQSAEAFERLAKQERGLEELLLDDKNTERSAGGKIRIKAIWSPWGQCNCLARAYQALLSEWKDRAATEERCQQRTLLAVIDQIGKGHDLKILLDQNEKERVHKLLLEDDKLFAKVEEAAGKLIDFLNSPAMKAMELDVAAATDTDARERFAAIREALERRLSETPKGRKYREEWFEEHHSLVIFDAVAGLKVTRKVPKAIWAWAKSWADVAAGYPTGEHKGEVPRALIKWVDKQSSRFGGVKLLSDCAWLDSVSEKQAWHALSPAEFVEWDRQRWKVGPFGGPEPPWAAKLKALEPTPFKFSPDRVAELKAKVNLNPRLNGLFCLVDAVNLAFAMRALLDGDFKDGWDKTKRVAAAASGLASFLGSALGFAESTTVHIGDAELADLRQLAAKGRISWDEGMRLARYERQGAATRGIARIAALRGVTKWLGALGAAADAWSGSVEMGQGLHEAKTGDSPDRIWIWPGLGAFGSAVACVGYGMIAFANPVGAVVVVAGSIVAAAGAVGQARWPGLVSSDVEKWLMHSFVGKHRLSAIDEEETFTRGKRLYEYHKDLALQIDVLDQVLFDFQIAGEFTDKHGRPMFTIDVAFRQLKIYSRVRMAVLALDGGQWKCVRNETDWHTTGSPPNLGQPGQGRMEGAFRFLDGAWSKDYPEMQIAVQIDVLGDGSFLYPPEPRICHCRR